jgi:prevent-host-death family protein
MLSKNLDLRDALDHIISVSELGRGQASKVIQVVKSRKEQFIVVKNNKPEAIIMSIEEYNELMESKEELELLLLATERVKNANISGYKDFDQLLEEEGITHEQLDTIIDDVEIE